MLRLIERTLPAALHRLGLKIAYRVRHHWRKFRKAQVIGCNVIVTDLKGHVLMLRHSYGPLVWALPGGGVKAGEDPALAARRELDEELSITDGRLRPLGSVTGQVSGSPHICHLFELLVDQHPKPDNREVIEARFFPPHSLPEPMGEPTRQYLAHWQARKNSSG
ncbi:MAG: NUDIX domain-containing protein [Altererythrobacter sp.]|nr:NUDIX domain-containing protein [Altererythrobacter sp.]NNF94995.1 NUDIX domain-containing protein [Altererythrobacter sp.]